MPPFISKGALLASAALFASQWSVGQCKALCLQPHDMPKGYTQINSRIVSNRDWAKEVHASLAAVVKQFGRMGGYQTEYKKSLPGAVAHIASDFSQFHASKGATSFYTEAVAGAPHGSIYGGRVKRFPAVHVGHEASAFAADYRYYGVRYRLVIIYLHRGVFAGLISFSGPPGTFTTEQIAADARLTEGRLKKARMSAEGSRFLDSRWYAPPHPTGAVP